ncbi:hypothetical protein TNIN_301841 [Trichonephila inaurata madagascariensis]|uniref:Uncharacterized protein n=1 Tax=Trichonephila inaurata madagascariensis TaxID=2747483 RepID=A0A8X7BZS8_9ARAC|nr:hypothetical protein TNIN_301841 [Trichonephila inaurata madagascariensis]
MASALTHWRYAKQMPSHGPCFILSMLTPNKNRKRREKSESGYLIAVLFCGVCPETRNRQKRFGLAVSCRGLKDYLVPHNFQSESIS